MEIGLRVLRGPNWTMGDEDGGEGHVGTIVEQASDDTVHVIWDGGQVSTCRSGLSQGGYDLRVLDNATVGELYRPTSTVWVFFFFFFFFFRYR